MCVFHLTWMRSSSVFCHRAPLFSAFDMLVSLYFCSISPRLSLMSYFYCFLSLSFTFFWLRPGCGSTLPQLFFGCHFSLFPPQPFDLSTFHTPTPALHHSFCPAVPCFCPPIFGLFCSITSLSLFFCVFAVLPLHFPPRLQEL